MPPEPLLGDAKGCRNRFDSHPAGQQPRPALPVDLAASGRLTGMTGITGITGRS